MSSAVGLAYAGQQRWTERGTHLSVEDGSGVDLVSANLVCDLTKGEALGGLGGEEGLVGLGERVDDGHDEMGEGARSLVSLRTDGISSLAAQRARLLRSALVISSAPYLSPWRPLASLRVGPTTARSSERFHNSPATSIAQLPVPAPVERTWATRPSGRASHRGSSENFTLALAIPGTAGPAA